MRHPTTCRHSARTETVNPVAGDGAPVDRRAEASALRPGARTRRGDRRRRRGIRWGIQPGCDPSRQRAPGTPARRGDPLTGLPNSPPAARLAAVARPTARDAVRPPPTESRYGLVLRARVGPGLQPRGRLRSRVLHHGGTRGSRGAGDAPAGGASRKTARRPRTREQRANDCRSRAWRHRTVHAGLRPARVAAARRLCGPLRPRRWRR
jgi:hypothetical protein